MKNHQNRHTSSHYSDDIAMGNSSTTCKNSDGQHAKHQGSQQSSHKDLPHLLRARTEPVASTQTTKEVSKAHAHTEPHLLRPRTTSLEGSKLKKMHSRGFLRKMTLAEEVAMAIKPWDATIILLENLEKQAEPKKRSPLLLHLQNVPVAEGLHISKSKLGSARDLDEDAFVEMVSQSYPWAAKQSLISVSMTLNIDYWQLSADDKLAFKETIRGILAESAGVDDDDAVCVQRRDVCVHFSPGSVNVEAEIRTPNANSADMADMEKLKNYMADMAARVKEKLTADMEKLKVTSLEVKTISEAQSVFDLMDSHASKQLSIGEWAGAMAAFFKGTQEEKARALFDLLDEDREGGLSNKELEERLIAPIKAMTPREASPLVRLLARFCADQIMKSPSVTDKTKIPYETKISYEQCQDLIRWQSLMDFITTFVEEEVDKDYVQTHLAKVWHCSVKNLKSDWQSERLEKSFSTDSAWHEVRKFKFLLDGSQHEVAVAHKEFVWQVSLDGALVVDQKCHTLSDNVGRAEFQVVAPTGVKVPARLEMSWVLKNMKWTYHLQVGDVNVPSSWNKVKDVTEKDVNCPEIFSAKARPLAQRSPLTQDGFGYNAAARMFAPEREGKESQSHQSLRDIVQTLPGQERSASDPELPKALPQGMSYDSEAKTYQDTSRWISL